MNVSLTNDYILLRDARGHEPLDYVALDTPLHGADEAFRRRWRVGGADLQESGATKVGLLGIQFPMMIRPPGRVTRTICLATSNGFGANIAPKMLNTRSKLLIRQLPQIAGVAFLKPAV